MTTELKACLAILKQPILERRAKGSLALSWILICVAVTMLVVGIAVATPRGRPMAIGFGVGVPVVMLWLMWWIYLLGSIVEQCRPAGGRLIPRLRERAQIVATATWGVATLSIVLTIGLPLGHPWHVAVIAGLVLLEMHLARGWASTFVIFLIIFAPKMGLPTGDWFFAFMNSNAAAAFGLAVVAFELRRFLRGMFGASPHLAGPASPPRIEGVGDREAAQMQRIAGLLHSITGARADDRLLFMRVLDAQANSAGRLELIVLVVVCGALAGWNAFHGRDAHAELYVARSVIVAVLLVVQVFSAFNLLGSFAVRIQEQGLVRLAAGTPNARDMNRILATHFLTRLAGMWCSYGALSVAAVLALGATQDEALRVLALCGFALPLIGVPLADHARVRSTLAGTLLLLTVAATVGAFIAVAGVGGMFGWSVVASVTICAAASFVWIRWSQMIHSPPAFPGRRC